MATALAFWWTALDRRTPMATALLAVWIVIVASGALGAVLTFAPRPIYRTYASADGGLADQQLAGLLMWIPGGVPLALAAVFVVARATATRTPR
jgi:cytochrome c oxidase assembly factor CtaG